MATFERFEDITAWQKARVLMNRVYIATEQAPFAKDFGLRDQIRRTSTSIMANIAEGYGRGGDKEFIQFLFHATGSAREVQSHLYVAVDNTYIEKTLFRDLYNQVDEICRLIGGLMQYLESSPMKGKKFAHRQPVSRSE